MKTWSSIKVGTIFKTGSEIISEKKENYNGMIDDFKNGFYTARCVCGNCFPVIFPPDLEGMQLCADCFKKRFGKTPDEEVAECEARKRAAIRRKRREEWCDDRVAHGLPKEQTYAEEQNYRRLKKEYPRLWRAVCRHGEWILDGDENYNHLTIPLYLLTEDRTKLNTGAFMAMLEDLIPQKCKDYEKDKTLVLDKDKLNRDGRNLFVPGRISIIHGNENHKYRKVK